MAARELAAEWLVWPRLSAASPRAGLWSCYWRCSGADLMSYLSHSYVIFLLSVNRVCGTICAQTQKTETHSYYMLATGSTLHCNWATGPTCPQARRLIFSFPGVRPSSGTAIRNDWATNGTRSVGRQLLRPRTGALRARQRRVAQKPQTGRPMSGNQTAWKPHPVPAFDPFDVSWAGKVTTIENQFTNMNSLLFRSRRQRFARPYLRA